eukprot:TRINITY_DN2353_c0_g1_i1.p1 TRINITY_DN2353_c0_g1~~TRINITY_DN2353_c0_g1_i1.p1  ORF type:complete len:191 (+),score=48.32 TRINITY_DN2353_c0_g1_i1:131-703(+)
MLRTIQHCLLQSHTQIHRESSLTTKRKYYQNQRRYSVQENIKQYEAKMRAHYEVLGLDFFASKEEIKKAYLVKVKSEHPDSGAKELDSFLRIKSSYEAIKDAPMRPNTVQARKKRVLDWLRIDIGRNQDHAHLSMDDPRKLTFNSILLYLICILYTCWMWGQFFGIPNKYAREKAKETPEFGRLIYGKNI